MTFRVLHQVGHFSKWNFDAFSKAKIGDGLILSPVHQARTRVEAMQKAVKKKALFDPQYYLPNSQKSRLASYDFFPEKISNGFETNEFHLVALKSATKCVRFQIEQDFESVVVPARFFENMTSKYFEKQEEYSVTPFLKALEKEGTSKKIILTLPITSGMLTDPDCRTDLLNWITGFPDIAGVYLLVNDDRATKQIQSAGLISSYFQFVSDLTEADLLVTLGHLNTESILFTMFDDADVTIGSFENTRMFSLDKFIESEEERRAPKARIYLAGLFNWIQFDQALKIRTDHPGIWDQLYVPTVGSELLFDSGKDPYFNQPDLYMHQFEVIYDQLKRLSKTAHAKRFETLMSELKTAKALYAELSHEGVDLDVHGRGKHIDAWIGALSTVGASFF
jgi:hypothetical protein